MFGGTFLFLISMFVGASDFSFAAQDIRVRLKRQLSVVEITGHDLRIGESEEVRGGFHRLKIQAKPKSTAVYLLTWDRERKPVEVAGNSIFVRGQFLRVGSREAPEVLEIRNSRGLEVVAHLNLEDYLLGVLPAEMPVSWPEDALKAQAVSARSFALRQAFERRKKTYDVESTVMDQVFRFEAKSSPGLSKVKQAIADTRGEILVDERKAVLKAFYSADCGCQSEDPAYVWGKIAAYESVKDPTCLDRAATQWTAEFPVRDVQEKLIAHLGLNPRASLQSLSPGRKTPSGRVQELIAQVSVDGQAQIFAVNSQVFRKLLGFQKIQSTDFSLVWSSDTLEVRGQGSGHGVGLCQQGARSLAAAGVGYREILKTYYPRARLLPSI